MNLKRSQMGGLAVLLAFASFVLTIYFGRTGRTLIFVSDDNSGETRGSWSSLYVLQGIGFWCVLAGVMSRPAWRSLSQWLLWGGIGLYGMSGFVAGMDCLTQFDQGWKMGIERIIPVALLWATVWASGKAAEGDLPDA